MNFAEMDSICLSQDGDNGEQNLLKVEVGNGRCVLKTDKFSLSPVELRYLADEAEKLDIKAGIRPIELDKGGKSCGYRFSY